MISCLVDRQVYGYKKLSPGYNDRANTLRIGRNTKTYAMIVVII
jgi:hypothetical protein